MEASKRIRTVNNVVSLMDRDLTPEIKQIIAKGYNFDIFTKILPTVEIMSIEKARNITTYTYETLDKSWRSETETEYEYVLNVEYLTSYNDKEIIGGDMVKGFKNVEQLNEVEKFIRRNYKFKK